MPTREHLHGLWREWHHARIATLTRPYGWTSLIAQHWLAEGDEGVVLDPLPGTWGVERGRVVFTPPPSGPTLSVDGAYARHPVEIVPGRNQSYGHGLSVPVFSGRYEVETIVRSDESAHTVHAVRVRDPEAARTDLHDLAAFDYDPAWRVPAVFEPAEYREVAAETVETGVRETTTVIGTLRIDLGGRSRDLTVIGKDSATAVHPVLHVRDRTSGDTTYGAGRVVEMSWADGGGIDVVDFNYLVALPCAFTNFVTCPLPPRQNHLDVGITAGEKRPSRDVDRVLTYTRGSGPRERV